MKNKKGFTLVELLAVIVILGIILVIATSRVINHINDSRAKAKYIAAKDIVEIAEAYIETETEDIENGCVSVITLINKGYLEEDVTNPETGENGNINDNQVICKDDSSSSDKQVEYSDNNGQGYYFDGYMYRFVK